MSLEAVQAFYRRLENDPVFYKELKNSKTKDDCRAMVQSAGYNFTQSELTDYTVALLEPTTSETELSRLGVESLATVVGGATALTGPVVVMPPYGHVPFENR